MVSIDPSLNICLSVQIDWSFLKKFGIYHQRNAHSGVPEQRLAIGLSGDLDELGNWDPHRAILLKCDKNTERHHLWSFRFTCRHLNKQFEYRYFLAELKEDEDGDKPYTHHMLRLLVWESRLRPRMCSLGAYSNSLVGTDSTEPVTFGGYGNETFLQRGWLTSTTEIHVRLSGQACKFFPYNLFKNSSQKPHDTLYVNCFKHIVRPVAYDHESENDTVSCDRAQPVLLSSLDAGRCRAHRGNKEESWGTPYSPGDDITFYVETDDVENTAIMIEFHQLVQSSTLEDNSPTLKFLGCARFGPFVGTYGRKASQMLSSRQLPIGDVRVRYLVIHPMVGAPQPSLAFTYQHHWKKHKVFDIGHRGMGTSFLDLSQKDIKKPATSKENTLDSFRTAVQHGADFVEMDVQLTKDYQVVVYHDYETVIIPKKKRGGRLSYLPIAVKDLNYSDLRELKVNHYSVMHENHTHEKMDEEDLDPVDMQSFPLLRSCFEEIDPDLGFVIEVKYPMELKNGGHEMANFFEYNFYVDTILREILTYAGSRRILLSCFDPNVCVALQLKQNLYPVFQLGIDPEYADIRQSNFQQLFWSAVSHQLLGVCIESDRVLDEPDVLKLAHEHNLVVLVWGEAVNCPEKRDKLSLLGVDGIIYDCLHESREKGTLNIFKREEHRPSITTSSSVPKMMEYIMGDAPPCVSTIDDVSNGLHSTSVGEQCSAQS